jgi:hypothetical protein
MEDEISRTTSFSSLFSTPGNRRRMRLIFAIGMFAQWRYVIRHLPHIPALKSKQWKWSCLLLHQHRVGRCGRDEYEDKGIVFGSDSHPFLPVLMSVPSIKASINGGLQIFNLIMAIGASLLVDWAGRRKLFLTSNTGMLLGKL